MSQAERQKADKIAHKMNLIEQEMQAASNLFKQGRKTDAAKLFVACGEGYVRLQGETQDDPMFIEALKARV